MNRDYTLIMRMRRGDEEAFNLFVHKYYEDILRYCTYHCFVEEDAKDLTQDTFLRFFSGLSNYSHRDKAKNYLYTIARNLCKNYNKRNKTCPFDSLEEVAEETSSEIDFATEMTIHMCVDRLNDDLREVIILYYYQDLKQSEIANILDIGLPLVKYRLKKAREQLKEMLEMEE